MKFAPLFRVFLALFVGGISLGGNLVVAQPAPNQFAITAGRTCDHDVIVRWTGINLEKVEFSATDTSLNWTTGWIEADDLESEYHQEAVGRIFDKVAVKVTFTDSSTAEAYTNITSCSDNVPEPFLPPYDPDATGTIEASVSHVTSEWFAGVTVCIEGTTTCSETDQWGRAFFTDLPQREYTLTASVEGYTADPQTTDLTGADLATIFFVMVPVAAPQPTAIVTPAPTPGGGQTINHHDGSFVNPLTGNSFEFLTAQRVCDTNDFRTTWAGTNIESLDFAVYGTGGGTDWIPASTDIGAFSTSVSIPNFNRAQAGVTFDDGSTESIMISISDCTAATVIPNAGIGESNLRVQVTFPGNVDISGASYNLYAPVAAAQFMADPYLSGFVGSNNTVAIDGLVPSQYRLVVYPAGMDSIDVMITVGDGEVTNAVATVNADGTASVAYAAQESPAPTVPAEQPVAPGDQPAGSGESSDTSPAPATSDVSGLPSTGSGPLNTLPIVLAAIAIAALSGLSLLSRYGITRKH